jgi:hypothetical protein
MAVEERTCLASYLKRFLKKSILELAGRLCASRQLVSTLDLAKKLTAERNRCVSSPARIAIKTLEKILRLPILASPPRYAPVTTLNVLQLLVSPAPESRANISGGALPKACSIIHRGPSY